MFEKQRKITETVLYDYFMISSCFENNVHTPFPYLIERGIYEKMTAYAQVLNDLTMRLIDLASHSTDKLPFAMGDFPFKQEVLSQQCPLQPFFWVRYDAFIRKNRQGIFFSEFNYDKPCAQREILFSDYFEPHGNPNAEFRHIFIEHFFNICEPYKKAGEKTGVAFLVSPDHDEEIHLANLFMQLLQSDDLQFYIVSTDNLQVREDTLTAFGQPVSIVFRLFPTEFLYYIDDFDKILRLHNEGKIRLVNDPRAIIGQTKTLFAFFWTLVEENSPHLTDTETKVIRESIPYTCLFREFDIEMLKANKDNYVIKAAYGRYSEQVYIGRMYEAADWISLVNEVEKSEELHIVQEFCPIEEEYVLRFEDDRYVYDTAYGNFGIYLSNDMVCGSCIRWSCNYLSSDDTVWVSPIGINDRHLTTTPMAEDAEYRQMWQTVNEEAAFQHGFSGGYTGAWQSFSLNAVMLDSPVCEEIKQATESISRLMNKTVEYVQQNGELLYPVLGIPQKLQTLVSQNYGGYHNFIGRFDFVLDSAGNLRLLEFNAETPAGIIESTVLNALIANACGKAVIDPNDNLRELVTRQFLNILKGYETQHPVCTIAFVSLSYEEDYYNTKLLFDWLSSLPYHFVFGEISGLHTKDGRLYLYNEPVDAVYRYYPLDWFADDPYFDGILPAFETSALSINPPSSFIAQSKAFFALIWELNKAGFYQESESDCIQRYIPFTSLDRADFPDGDYCFKPYFSREGDGVGLSILGQQPEPDTDVVYQERVDIRPVHIPLYSSSARQDGTLYPILGAFVLGETFGGIYTRGGDIVTDKNAVYLPTYIAPAYGRRNAWRS